MVLTQAVTAALVERFMVLFLMVLFRAPDLCDGTLDRSQRRPGFKRARKPHAALDEGPVASRSPRCR